MTRYALHFEGAVPTALSLAAASLLANADLVVGSPEVLDVVAQSIGAGAELLSVRHAGAPVTGAALLHAASGVHRAEEDVVVALVGGSDAPVPGAVVLPAAGRGPDDPALPLPRTGRLVGAGVLITRAAAQAQGLGERLLVEGARPCYLPVIEIEVTGEMRDGLAAAVARGRPDWVVLSSQNAVATLSQAAGLEALAGRVRLACVGPATAAAAARAGMRVDFVPTVATARALAAELPAPGSGRATVLFVAGERAGQAVEDGLRTRGFEVDRVDAYRTIGAHPGPSALLRARAAEAVVFTSPSTVDESVRLLGRGGLPGRVVTIGPSTSEAARAAGLEVAGEAVAGDLDSLADALVRVLRFCRDGRD